tara:strand:- start:927 stop:1532 length:606 start_codon:yes stop_codon:yes gene_type:complete
MTTTTDLKINEPSLCIPRVFANITDERVWGVFNELNIGEIDRIDMVHKEGANNNVSYQRVFVHFKMWYSTPEAADVRKRLVKGDAIKIVYDDPWYWKVSASHSKRPRAAGERKPPRIEFTDKAPITPVRVVKDPLNEGLSVEAAEKLSAMMDDGWSRPPAPTKLKISRSRFGDGISDEPMTPTIPKMSWADVQQQEEDAMA